MDTRRDHNDWAGQHHPSPTLLRLVAAHQIEAAQFATHHFNLHEMIEAYDVFARAADTGAIKVVLAR